MLILGDIHGNFKLINQYSLSNCNVIQVGDFGLGFDKKDEKTMDYWNTSWNTRHTHVYAIRGNHDKPEYWDGRYNGRWSNITLVPDYTVLNIEGKNLLCIGGARSIDRSDRVSVEDGHYKENMWFEGEDLQYDEDKLMEKLREYDKIDVVITHCSPNKVYPYSEGLTMANYALRDKYVLLESRLERSLLTRMYEVMIGIGKKPAAWIYGHYHNTHIEFIEGTKFVCLGVGEITNI